MLPSRIFSLVDPALAISIAKCRSSNLPSLTGRCCSYTIYRDRYEQIQSGLLTNAVGAVTFVSRE
jgi:hypothetical protein